VAEAGENRAEIKDIKIIVANFLGYAAKQLTTHPVYPSIIHYKDVLSEALVLADDQIADDKKKEVLLICELADIGTGSSKAFSTGDASVFVSQSFKRTELHKSFLRHKGAALLSVSKTSTCNERRMEGLKQVRGMQSVLPKDVTETAEVALKLFDEASPLTERVRYLAMCVANNLQVAVHVAMTWDPVGIMGCVAKLLQDVPPAFLHTPVATFRAACHAINDADVCAAMKSPISSQVATYVFGGFHPTAKPTVADDRVMAFALAERLQFTAPCNASEPGSALNTAALVYENISYETEAFKKTRAFLSASPDWKLSSKPDWYSTWEKPKRRSWWTRKRRRKPKRNWSRKWKKRRMRRRLVSPADLEWEKAAVSQSDVASPAVTPRILTLQQMLTLQQDYSGRVRPVLISWLATTLS